MKKSFLLAKALELPTSSGCYLMKDKRGQILYVGKAKNLKARVGSYFNESLKSIKTEHLVERISDFDFILAASEAEAFVLENNLIKQFSPKYNIRLRDDKTYPYLLVDFKKEFPILEYTRKTRSGVELFGPFATGTNLRGIIRILNKLFALRDCSEHEFKARETPCLLYQMKQCTAPCVALVNRTEYLQQVRSALAFFKGQGKEALQVLNEKMMLAAEKEDFEYAAQMRDQIEELKNFLSLQQQHSAEFLQVKEDLDLVAYYQGEEEVDFVIVMIRQGLQLGHKFFHFTLQDNLELEEEGDEISFLSRLLLAYYKDHETLRPQKLVLNYNEDHQQEIKKWLNFYPDLQEIKIIEINKEKRYQALQQLAEREVREAQRMRQGKKAWVSEALTQLQEYVQLKEKIRVIECYDIAIWQGKTPTASQVVFREYEMDKKSYRYYHLQERPEGNNDFAMMEEFIKRRIVKGDLPDLMVVDGGRGQAQIIRRVLDEHHLSHLPVVGLAKARSKKGTEERLVLLKRKNDIPLTSHRALLRLLVQLRNEAHRFSRVLHHKGEQKRVISSFLDGVKGISLEKKRKILRELDLSTDEWQKMNAQELASKLDIPEDIAEIILVQNRNHLA